jgi:hypothetical protein
MPVCSRTKRYFTNISSFSADQEYFWSCPYFQSGAMQSFTNPHLTITRSVFQGSDGCWRYQVSKSGLANTILLPNQ